MSKRNLKADPVSVGLISLGCAKNLVDSQIMAGSLLQQGMTFVPSPEGADIVIVNTCAFIDAAREESADAIRSACEFKTDGKCRAVIVAGCMSQRYGDKIKSAFPDVDAFIGLDELDKIGEVAGLVMDGRDDIVQITHEAGRVYDPEFPELVLTGGPYAYVKIAEGCNHHCSFCAIPLIRGKARSRTMDNILAEAETLLVSGIRELNLISQDVTSYGKDFRNKTNLAGLLRELGGLGDEGFWVRLLYGYPDGITDELLEVMSENRAICHYLDIPIQHSHPDILKAMRRAKTSVLLEDMYDRIRTILPDAALRTTCMVGFPGETEAHFMHMLEFIKRVEFDHLGVFVYSPEENTKAFSLPDMVDRETAEERRHQIMMAQQEIVDKKAQLLIGQHAEVLLERLDPENKNVIIGRSARQAPEIDGEIYVHGASEEEIGNLIKVRYSQQLDYDMVGEKE